MRPMLETETASRSGLVDTKEVADLPLSSGRNPFTLGITSSGVTFRGASIWQRPFDNGAIADWVVNGGWQESNEFLLDGASNNAHGNGIIRLCADRRNRTGIQHDAEFL